MGVTAVILKDDKIIDAVCNLMDELNAESRAQMVKLLPQTPKTEI